MTLAEICACLPTIESKSSSTVHGQTSFPSALLFPDIQHEFRD